MSNERDPFEIRPGIFDVGREQKISHFQGIVESSFNNLSRFKAEISKEGRVPKISDEKREFIFRWKIENAFHDAVYGDGKIPSIKFRVLDLQGTRWKLKLYIAPHYISSQGKYLIDCHLQRCANFSRLENTDEINFQLSFLDSNSKSYEIVRCIRSSFEKGKSVRESLVIKANHLQNKDLTIFCRMWKDGERSSKIAHSPKGPGLTLLTISSVFKVNILSLLSDYAPDEEFYLIANSRTQPQIKLTLFVDRIKKLVMVKVEKLNNSINLLSAICSQTKYETSTDNDIDYKSYVNGLLISLNLNSLFDTEVLYFPSDILTFRCRCTFTSGYDCEIIDETTCGLHLLTEIRREIPPEIPQKSKSSVSEATSDSPTALQDFKALFNDPVLSDVKIMTKTKTFPAHKMVLCARSAVFRAMLTNEMKEKSTEIIRIDDLEDNIVHHFLLFLYTDDIKNLLSDTVKELYYAADKYDVPLLKEKCTAFMKKNLSIKNACDLLQLADIHQDSCLKTFVEDFIFRQHKVIIASETWQAFSETNPMLALKTVNLMYKK